MKEFIKAVSKNTKDLAKLLPEKAELSVLEHFGDIVMLKGLRRMEEIIESDVFQAGDVTIPITPSDKIKGLNAVINLGRLVEQRLERQGKENPMEIEIPDALRIKTKDA